MAAKPVEKRIAFNALSNFELTDYQSKGCEKQNEKLMLTKKRLN